LAVIDSPVLTLKSWPKQQSPAVVLAIFYFPGCSVERGVDKDIRLIKMSGITRANDMLRTDDSFRIYGTWLNDDDGRFDNSTTIDRVESLYSLCKNKELYGSLTWGDKTYSETLILLPHTLDCDQEPGNVGMFGYNFLFAVLTKEPSA
jgi:hypothetical protein